MNLKLRCSFCGESQNQVETLITGPGVNICDECLGICNTALAEALSEEARDCASAWNF